MWVKTSLVGRWWKLKREGIIVRVIIETGGRKEKHHTLLLGKHHTLLLGRPVCFLHALLPVLVKCLVFPYGYP